jgi:hypothetical protein
VCVWEARTFWWWCVCVCVSGGAEEERYPRRPAQQPSSRHSAHLFFSRNISYPALADAGFLFSFFSNICEKMLLYGTPPPSPWSQIPKPIPQPHLLPVPRNLRVSGGAPHQFTSEVTSARLRGGQVGRKKAISVKLGA